VVLSRCSVGDRVHYYLYFYLFSLNLHLSAAKPEIASSPFDSLPSLVRSELLAMTSEGVSICVLCGYADLWPI
jgi:hypothetical protein